MNLEDKFNDILLLCCNAFDTDIVTVKSKSRKQEVVYCRKAFCKITMDLFELKYETVSTFLDISINSAWNHRNNQPLSRYYMACLNSVIEQLKISLSSGN